MNGNADLGNAGVGAMNLMGGVLTVTGNLVAGGAGTLVPERSAGSVATYFGGNRRKIGDRHPGHCVQPGQPSGNEALTSANHRP